MSQYSKKFQFDISWKSFSAAASVAVSSHLCAELVGHLDEFAWTLASAVVLLMSLYLSGHWKQMLPLLFGVVSLTWTVQAVRHLLPIESGYEFEPLDALLLIVGLGGLLYCYRATKFSPGVIVVEEKTVRNGSGQRKLKILPEAIKAEGVILFLSSLGIPKGSKHNLDGTPFSHRQYFEQLMAELPSGAKFGDPCVMLTLNKYTWLMPLRAIDDQLSTPPVNDVLRVIVITSADETVFDEKTGKSKLNHGTYRALDDFVTLAERLGGKAVDIQGLAEWTQGVPFEDMTKLSDAVNSAKIRIRERSVRRESRRPIVIDITGGQKPCSAVGAALSFAGDECVQYISTGATGRIKLYDLEFIPTPSPMH